ncbi:hypothetical protein [Steroidobacter agaridevorans]|nr:hypothetical protein [Steroidobacter agaridevorans]
MSDLNVGDGVVLVKVPDWLLKDLPEDEQREILSFIGQSAIVMEIDKFGYLWVGFGSQVDHGEESRYSGHSFAVTADCLERQ